MLMIKKIKIDIVKYFYKIVMVCIQANLLHNQYLYLVGLLSVIVDIRLILETTNYVTILICLYLYEYWSLYDI